MEDDPPAEVESVAATASAPSDAAAAVEATNLEVRIGPSEPAACPAKSHINQCTCNFELELKGKKIAEKLWRLKNKVG